MKFNGFHKYIVLFLMTLAIVSFNVSAYAQEEKPLTKEDVIKIIEEYIEENPDELLQALIQKSRNRLKKKQQESVEQYKDLIFYDANSPIAGNAKSEVIVVEFVDYNCGFCKKSSDAIAKLLEEDKEVKVIFKELPVLGEASKMAAKYALAADRQDKYVELHMALMNNRKPITTVLIKELAEKAGLDVAKLEKDITSEIVEKQIEKDYNLALKMGLTGTPVFIIGDKLHMGALTSKELKEKLKDYRDRVRK